MWPRADAVAALQAPRGARIVNLTSGGHRLSDIRWDDPHFTRDYEPLVAYGQSKTAKRPLRGGARTALLDAVRRQIVDPSRERKTAAQRASAAGT